MLFWALVFFLLAVVSGLFGFGGLAAAFVDVARVLFFVFIVIFVLALLFGWRGRRR